MHPVLIDLGEIQLGGVRVPLAIGSYGAVFLLAIAVGWLVCRREGRRLAPAAPWGEIYAGTVIAGVIGAKLLHGLVLLPEIANDWTRILGVLRGGGVWLGGVIAGSMWLANAARRDGLHVGRVFDLFFTGVPLVHAIGRVGCLLGGCCYGAGCALPWAITYTSALAAGHNGTPLGVPLHPVPLYEALLELGNFALCYALWRRGTRPWSVVSAWGALYATERFLLEFLRGDPRGFLGPLSTSQWIALALVSAIAAFWSRRLVGRAAGR